MQDGSSKKIFIIGFLSGVGAVAIAACACFLLWRIPLAPAIAASSQDGTSGSSEASSAVQSTAPSEALPPPTASGVASGSASSDAAQASSSSETSSASSEAEHETFPGEFGALRDSDLLNDLKDEQIQLLYCYFDEYYRSLSQLRAADITGWFAPETPLEHENMLLNQTTLQMLCGTRAERENDLSLDSFQYGLCFTDIKELSDGRVKIELLEDSCLEFAFLEGVKSYTSGIEHTFVLTQSGDEWLISSHDREEDMFIRVWEQYCAARGSKPLTNTEASLEIFLGLYDTVLENAIKDEQHRIAQSEEFRDKNGRILIGEYSWAHNYDRKSAVEYALTWVDTQSTPRNSEWKIYDGNCQNYVSQCLFAGGIPMDCVGTSQWKWCGDAINTSHKLVGRSSSWAGVGDFYDYCKYNDERGGLVAQVNANLFSAKAGDVLQLGAFGNWYHSVLITEAIEGDDGLPIDFLISSNTADHIDFPASAYPYSAMRLIKIYGYN